MGKINIFFCLFLILSQLYSETIRIPCEMNTPVYATEAGVVTDCGFDIDDMDKGLFVEIESIEKRITYCHLSLYKVKKGQKVEEHDLIGNSGMSGNILEPELEIKISKMNKNDLKDETSVTLKNAKLQKVICKQLNKKDLSEQDLLGITEIFLNAKFGNVSDLDGIERLENLEKLIIYPGKLKSIASIRELKNLKYISINENPKIKDLEIIGEKSELTGICLERMKGFDFSFISKLEKLEEITILGCALEKIDFLKNLNPTDVCLWNNQIQYLPDLSGWTRIKSFSISGNPIVKNASIVDQNGKVRIDSLKDY